MGFWWVPFFGWKERNTAASRRNQRRMRCNDQAGHASYYLVWKFTIRSGSEEVLWSGLPPSTSSATICDPQIRPGCSQWVEVLSELFCKIRRLASVS
ncbi:hypothetical protein MGG_17445 [Pyricularia oryzae 70-15]|uniref:Uncharacterized protein n=4 Tax=Pyricularia oryzae TaxID=318829 RepID=G4NBR6_PYRO7|nr:uncharacterized protein MGG_17445 [Pyricularia oryzae 70-15]ELQ42518.1 hypothetical protein OOU_Y34scaffold00203g7 [Pyricularia oryzae Y34]KAI7916259.1 hypothetical protein M0657_008679 [Pyricularia oryzae]EHA48974.1 hypothetical protein MGG_17445 [Pyricularia oryzae 70-15]KAI7922305.1 hypothetical protein M9X92_004888 [Pyricularia oryzae]QBZ62801.1 hypothetical protein PoMZ_11688 [Pyricularia oryzae]